MFYGCRFIEGARDSHCFQANMSHFSPSRIDRIAFRHNEMGRNRKGYYYYAKDPAVNFGNNIIWDSNIDRLTGRPVPTPPGALPDPTPLTGQPWAG